MKTLTAEILNNTKELKNERANEWTINNGFNTFMVKKSYGEFGFYLCNRGSVTKIGMLKTDQDLKNALNLIQY